MEMKMKSVACSSALPGSAINKPSTGVIHRTVAFFFSSCWFFIAGLSAWLFNFVVFRLRKEDNSKVHGVGASIKEDSGREQQTAKVTDSYSRVSNSFEEKDPPTLCFKFQYQFSGNHKQYLQEETLQSAAMEENASPKLHNYQFISGKDVSGFIQEPEAKTCLIQEVYVDPLIYSSYDDNKSVSAAARANYDPVVHTIHEVYGFKEENFQVFESLIKEKPVISATNSLDRLEHFGPSIYSSYDDNKSVSAAARANYDPLVQTIHEVDGIKEENFQVLESLMTEKPVISATNSLDRLENFGQENILKEKRVTSPIILLDFSGFDSDTESMSGSDGYSVKDLRVDSDSDILLSDHEIQAAVRQGKFWEDFGRLEEAQSQLAYDYDEVTPETDKFSLDDHDRTSEEISQEENLEANGSDSIIIPDSKGLSEREAESNQVHSSEESKPQISDPLQVENTHCGGEELRATEELISSRRSTDSISRTTISDSEFSGDFDASEHGFSCQLAPCTQEEALLLSELDQLEREEETSENRKEKKVSTIEDLDEEDYDELESIWEHKDLIEQLRLELKRVRAITLPTIKEESEVPKSDEHLKPWMTDEKFLHEEDTTVKMLKFYKIYRERMKKLDILNHQKLYAIGLLQLKDPPDSIGSHKSLMPAITSLLSLSLGSCAGKFGINPSEKFIKELQHELEMVYVGQMCLSWEFLRWQYEKLRQLPESDPFRLHQFNQVAGELQQFQVILQRFIEDEAFQGPRLPNYVKNRCGVQSLLLVPVIREDSLKEKMVDKHKVNHVITSEILEDIMEESIGIFWEFVKGDKDETGGILKCLIGSRAELQDSTDYEFMADIQSNLHKKEKKIKDIVRTGNCLVKRFKKPKEDRTNQDLFFSQVDLKLVARVLRMSRISTEQLVWCHAKLSNITIIDGKVHRESSFLLFPC